jgi:hypothetical protein
MKLNTAVDIMELLAFVLSAASGIVLKMHIAGAWKPLHVLTSFVLVALVLIHILLHKTWFKNLVKGE